MKVLWCDTETTGLEPQNAGAFQIAMLFKHGNQKTKVRQRLFFLNPLDERYGIEYTEDSARIHGISRETIESYPKAEEQIPRIVSLFTEYCKDFEPNGKFEKLYFAGYNCPFDWDHLDALLRRYTDRKMSDFFETKFIDVYEQVKRAVCMGKIDPMNKKLGTVCKSLDVPLENAHDALGDITATRNLGARLQRMGVPLMM